jgi:hypothetical protein
MGTGLNLRLTLHQRIQIRCAFLHGLVSAVLTHSLEKHMYGGLGLQKTRTYAIEPVHSVEPNKQSNMMVARRRVAIAEVQAKRYEWEDMET